MKSALQKKRIRQATEAWSPVRIVAALAKLQAKNKKEDLGTLLGRLGLSVSAFARLNTYLLGLDPVMVQGLGQGPIGMVIETSVIGPGKRRQAYGTGPLIEAMKRLGAYPKRDISVAVGALELLATASLQHGVPLRALANRLHEELGRGPAPDPSDRPAVIHGRLPEGIQANLELGRQAAREVRELRFHYRGGSFKPAGQAKRRLQVYDVTPGNQGDFIIAGLDPDHDYQPRRFKLGQIFAPELGPTFKTFSVEQIANLRSRGTNTNFEASAPAVEVWARSGPATALKHGALRAKVLKGAKAPAWLKGDGWQAFTLRYHKPRDLAAVLLPWVPDVTVGGPKDYRAEWMRALGLLKRVYR